MSLHPALRPETGVPRGPERHGTRASDPERDQLRDELRRFEALADTGNPEHVQMLKQMREHTQELEWRRGVWTKRGLPGVTRDWNPAPQQGGPAPAESLLEFKAWKDATRKQALLEAGLPLPQELRAAPVARLAAPTPPEAAGRTAAARARCPLLRGAATRAEVLQRLDKESHIDWVD